MAFNGGGTLELAQSYNGTISGLTTGDTIDLANLSPASVIRVVWNSAASTLSINGSTTMFTIFGELPAGDAIAFKSDGHGGTDLVVLPQVFETFAASAQPRVEATTIPLGIGDFLVTGKP